MVDFRSRVRFPIEAFVKASQKPNKFDRLRLAVEGAESGLTKGLALSETIRGIKEKRANAAAIQDFITPSQLQQLPEGVSGPQNKISKADIFDRELGLPQGTSAGIVREEGVSGLKPLIQQRVKAQKAAETSSLPPAIFDAATQKFTINGVEVDELPKGTVVKSIDSSKGLPAESAGKAAALEQALGDLGDLRDLLFDRDEKGNITNFKDLVALGSLAPGGGVGETSRLVSSRINNALEAKLRIETGATATEPELKRLFGRFAPKPLLDNEKTALDKIARLEEFMRSAIIKIDPSGKYTFTTKPDASPAAKRMAKQMTNQKVKAIKGKIMIDAQGNKAMVFPDGTFKEVK